VEDGLLIRRELRPASGPAALRQKLARSSHLLQFLRAVQLSWQRPSQATHAGLAARDPWLLEFAKVHLRQYPEETARGVARTLEYLSEFQDFCRERGADFVLLVIPRSYQVYSEELKELQTAFQWSDADLDLDRPQRTLQEWAGRRGATMLDLLPVFRQHRLEHPGRKLFHYPDAHFNAEGHRLAAEELAVFLEQRGLPRLPASGTLSR
jgi:hypothetical protein